MPEVAEDTFDQLYKSLYAILKGDAILDEFIQANPEDPRIYQYHPDISPTRTPSGDSLNGLCWVEYGTTAVQPADIEQLQQIWVVRYSIHSYSRGLDGVGANKRVELMGNRIRELFNQQSLATPTLLCWYNLAQGYKKPYEQQPELWHVENDFETMVMAQTA